MASLRILAAALVAGGVLAGCGGGGSGGTDAPPQVVDINETYELDTGDRLRINVYGQPDVSGEFEVDSAGAISYPLLGPVQAKGETIQSLTQTIAERLDRDFIVDIQ